VAVCIRAERLVTAAGVIAALRAAGIPARAGFFGGIEIRVTDAVQLAELLGMTTDPAMKESSSV
jgi:hypothetical protein